MQHAPNASRPLTRDTPKRADVRQHKLTARVAKQLRDARTLYANSQGLSLGEALGRAGCAQNGQARHVVARACSDRFGCDLRVAESVAGWRAVIALLDELLAHGESS